MMKNHQPPTADQVRYASGVVLYAYKSKGDDNSVKSVLIDDLLIGLLIDWFLSPLRLNNAN